MGAKNNIITLKTGDASTVPLNMEEPKRDLSKEELESLVFSIQKVLNHMETIWEEDHGAVELRDKFHLLRCYLGYMKQYCEGHLP